MRTGLYRHLHIRRIARAPTHNYGRCFYHADWHRKGLFERILAVLTSIFQAILTSSTTRSQLLVGRVVTGFVSLLCSYLTSTDVGNRKGNGCNSSSIPVYQSETCRGPVRGALVCLNCTVTIVGLVIVSNPLLLRIPYLIQRHAGLLV